MKSTKQRYVQSREPGSARFIAFDIYQYKSEAANRFRRLQSQLFLKSVSIKYYHVST